MSSRFDNDGPQPPLLLKTPLEVYSNLRQILQSRDPLFISFADRQQSFQSYLLEIDRDQGVMALDELVPRLGEKYLAAGEPFKVEGFHEGVRISWQCESPVTISVIDGAPCYWTELPSEILYHQRRDAYRAAVPESETADVEVLDKTLGSPLFGRVIDISATGCRLRFKGDIRERLQNGAVLELLQLRLTQANIASAIEVRHVEYDSVIDMTFVGVKFHQPSGFDMRNIERFVYQLQREARRNV